MIPVTPADEPDTFDELVRQPGLRALARRVGIKVPGPGRPPKNIYPRREDIPSEEFPTTWREAIPDLMARYNNLCAYTALYIEDGTGDPTVDHFTPVSSDWHNAYEWSNYRLACGQANTNKGLNRSLDPFDIKDDWFELEIVGYQVVPGKDTADILRAEIWDTINVVLDLNSARFCKQRRAYAEAYLAVPGIPLNYLERRAPFIARELRRHGKLHPADQIPPEPA